MLDRCATSFLSLASGCLDFLLLGLFFGSEGVDIVGFPGGSDNATSMEDMGETEFGFSGVWEDKERTILNVSVMNEKPKASYAEEFLGVRNADGKKEYYSVFGQYILTPDVFAQLANDIAQADASGDFIKEIELTAALEAVRQQSGMMGVRLNGEMFDMGNPKALTRCILEFPR